MNKKSKLLALLLAGAMLGATLVSCGDKTTGDDTAVPAYSKGLDENGYFEGVRALDYVTLPEYKGVDVTQNMIEASEKDVQAQLDEVLAKIQAVKDKYSE